MKKVILFACAALFATIVRAEETFDMQKVKDADIKTITFTMTISRDDNHDEQAWSETVESAARAVKVAIDSKQENAKNDEVIDEALRAIKETYERCGDETGINGDLSIWLDDEQEDTAKGCGVVCEDCDCSETRGCDGVCGGGDKDDK